jgi:hypothetical protein
MSLIVPLAIPRWQWRTMADDLSRVFRRFPASPLDAGRQVEEIHLVCLHSSHSAILRGEQLELRWRKETGPGGSELWDSIVTVSAPFPAEAIARLWTVLGLDGRPPLTPFTTTAAFLDEAITPNPSVIPVRVARTCRETAFSGIACTLETVRIGAAVVMDSFTMEHEDPSVIVQMLAELGLDPDIHINLLQALKHVLGLPAENARNLKWPMKSNASSS